MSRVIELPRRPHKRIDYLTCDYTACPELERRILAARYELAESQIDSILEDRKRRVRAQQRMRLMANLRNWSWLTGEAVILGFALVAFVAACSLAAWVGYRP